MAEAAVHFMLIKIMSSNLSIAVVARQLKKCDVHLACFLVLSSII